MKPRQIILFLPLLVIVSWLLGSESSDAREISPDGPPISLEGLEIASLATALQTEEGTIYAYDPRYRQVVLFTENGRHLHSMTAAGSPAFFVASEGKLYSLTFSKPADIRPDANRLWVPGKFNKWNFERFDRRMTKDFSKVELADLTTSIRKSEPNSPPYWISTVLNYTVSHDDSGGPDQLAAIGLVTAYAQGEEEDESNQLAFFTFPISKSGPVSYQSPLGPRDISSYYRVYQYMASTRGTVYYVDMGDGQGPKLYRWSSKRADIPPSTVTELLGQFPPPDTVDPLSSPSDLMASVKSQKKRVIAGLLAKDGKVFILIREHVKSEVANWTLLRLAPNPHDEESMLVSEEMVLPTKATQVILSPGVDSGPWRLFEMGPLTEDFRQPVRLMIPLPATAIEGPSK